MSESNPPASTSRGDDGARSVVRRAEQSLVATGYTGEHPYAVRTIDRLSDLLFVLARNADVPSQLSKES